MFHMLVAKLGGLLDKRVYNTPFFRAIKVKQEEARAIHGTLLECMRSGGVLLVQPEHILSFKLMGIEYAILGRQGSSRVLLES
jgi:hypothetical protein